MTSATLLSRVAPGSIAGVGARRVFERSVLVWRRGWYVLLSGFFEPVFYLFSIGVGIGVLVGDVVDGNGDPVSYAAFVAPALLASSAMNGAVYESTFNIFFKLKYAGTYDAMLATPLEPRDIALGEISFSLLRGAAYSAGFLGVMAVMGLMPSAWGIMALPVSILIGFAFAAVGMAATTFMSSWQHFDLVQLVTLPLFLFSATFYPLSVYPEWLQMVAQISPLFHGVELIRGFTLGNMDPTMFFHAGFLVAMGLIGLAVAGRRIEQLLKT